MTAKPRWFPDNATFDTTCLQNTRAAASTLIFSPPKAPLPTVMVEKEITLLFTPEDLLGSTKESQDSSSLFSFEKTVLNRFIGMSYAD